VEGRQVEALVQGKLGIGEDGEPEPVLDQLCRCTAAAGQVSIETGTTASAPGPD
jgi:hypothetical protein